MQTMADHPRARFDLWSEAVGTRMRAWRAAKKGFSLAAGDPGRCNICTYDGPCSTSLRACSARAASRATGTG